MFEKSADGLARKLTPGEALSWKTTLGLSLLICAARLVYLIWFCPYELAADEAHYWEWSRRPALSYYSKGPGVAWVIAVSTRLLGLSEWAVRVPTALASLACTLLLARLASSMFPKNERTGFFAATVFMLTPVFYASSQFMTIDSPYYACWVLASLVAWRIHLGPATRSRFFILGTVLGLGMLFKYTILLLIPGLVFFFLRYSRSLTPRRLGEGLLYLLTGLMLVASPIFLWNHQNGWPTVAHLIGRIGAPGGDVPPHRDWFWNPLWTAGYILYPLVVLGPPATVLLMAAIRKHWRLRTEHPGNWESTMFALSTALPIALFYGLLSLRTDIELNWAVAGLTVLLVPLAGYLATQLEVSPGVRAGWRWILGFGIACALLVSFGKHLIEPLDPILSDSLGLSVKPLLHRVSGSRKLAITVESLAAKIREDSGQSPIIIARSYTRAGLLAFYMPSRPNVYSASALFGDRESSYDYFKDTSLADPALLGRPAIMVGATEWAWDEALYFRRVVKYGGVFVGYDYRGPSLEPRMR
jgi:4-amino-4-deoxy-L-arabinose transferase-like glycosyltransferase